MKSLENIGNKGFLTSVWYKRTRTKAYVLLSPPHAPRGLLFPHEHPCGVASGHERQAGNQNILGVEGPGGGEGGHPGHTKAAYKLEQARQDLAGKGGGGSALASQVPHNPFAGMSQDEAERHQKYLMALARKLAAEDDRMAAAVAHVAALPEDDLAKVLLTDTEARLQVYKANDRRRRRRPSDEEIAEAIACGAAVQTETVTAVGGVGRARIERHVRTYLRKLAKMARANEGVEKTLRDQ